MRTIKNVMFNYYKTHPEYYDSLEKVHKDSDISSVAKIITKIIKENNCKRILDAGCGSGDLCFALEKMNPSIDIYGIDWSAYTVSKLNKRAKVNKSSCKFKQADLEKEFPFEKQSFDLVISTQVIEHLTRPDKAIINMKHVLKNNGLLYLRFIGLYRCFSMPFKQNLLKIYDSIRMIFNANYIKFRFIDPELKGVLEDTDMVYLSYVPEIVRFIEKNNMTCLYADTRGEIIAVNGSSKRKFRFRFVKYCYQTVKHILNLIRGKSF